MSNPPSASPTIAVLIPCYQEEKTIAKVVADMLSVPLTVVVEFVAV